MQAPPHVQPPKFIPNNYGATSRPTNSSFYTDISTLVDPNSHSNSSSDALADNRAPSPVFPGQSYHYHRRGPLDASNSPDVHEHSSNNSTYSHNGFPSSHPSSQNGYHSTAHHPSHSPTPIESAVARISQRDFDTTGPYLSESPSPIDVRPSSFPQPLGSPRNQEQFPSTSVTSYPSDHDRFAFGVSDRYTSAEKFTFPPTDQRRMSEPAIFCNSPYSVSDNDSSAGRIPNFQFAYNPPVSSPRSLNSAFSPSLHRGISTGSLRELHNHHHHVEYPHAVRHRRLDSLSSTSGLDEPISPLNAHFPSGTPSTTLEMSGLHYSPIAEDPYPSSPPGTGTSTSSNTPGGLGSPCMNSHNVNSGINRCASSVDNSNKTYSFVALPGNAVKKRPRRRFDEIERLYQCSWPDCTKAYGTLNHLNAHVTMQKHGPKRSPNEFKELRKQRRKQKKDEIESFPGLQRDNFRQDSEPDLQLFSHHHPHLRHHASVPHHLGLASSMGVDGRYTTATSQHIDDVRYPSHDFQARREEHRRASYAGQGSTPVSWHPGMVQQPPPRSLHSHFVDDSQEYSNPRIHSNMSLSSSPIAANRLPPDSTLLTPLPGYEPPTLLPPLQARTDVGYDAYDSYGGVYEDEGRPSSGHASLGGASADGEYEV